MIDKALDHPDPLQALVRASSGDLADTAGQLKDAIDQALQDEPDFRNVFEEVSPLLEMYLKFQRPFDRFVQLDRRLSTPSSPSAASPPPPTALSFAGKSSPTACHPRRSCCPKSSWPCGIGFRLSTGRIRSLYRPEGDTTF